MKSLILTVMLSLSSWSDDEIKVYEMSIEGAWNLIKFESGFSPTENFEEGKIIWSFQQNNTLKIQIDNSINSIPIKPNGEYEFFLNENLILIDNIEYDFSISENTIIISDNPASDGFRATFLR